MNADRIGFDHHLAAILRTHSTACHHVLNLGERGLHVFDHRAHEIARRQRAIGLIAAIGEYLVCNPQARIPPGRLRDLLLGPALFAATYPIVSVIAQPQATLPSSIYCWLLIGMLIKAPTLERTPDADQLLRAPVYPG